MIKRIKPGKRFCEAVVVNGVVTTSGVTGDGADTGAQTRDILAQIDGSKFAHIKCLKATGAVGNSRAHYETDERREDAYAEIAKPAVAVCAPEYA